MAARATLTRFGHLVSSSSGSIRASATRMFAWSILGRPSISLGTEILSGDLIHADKHGVCLIPQEIAPRLAEACAEVERRERPLLDSCGSDQFSLEEYIKLRACHHAKTHE